MFFDRLESIFLPACVIFRKIVQRTRSWLIGRLIQDISFVSYYSNGGIFRDPAHCANSSRLPIATWSFDGIPTCAVLRPLIRNRKPCCRGGMHRLCCGREGKRAKDGKADRSFRMFDRAGDIRCFGNITWKGALESYSLSSEFLRFGDNHTREWSPSEETIWLFVKEASCSLES